MRDYHYKVAAILLKQVTVAFGRVSNSQWFNRKSP